MNTWEPPKGLDPECLNLCKALNAIPGIKTFESCCGHNKYPYWVWFYVFNLEGLKVIAHSGFNFDRDLKIGIDPSNYETPAKMDRIRFRLDLPQGRYDLAESLAASIMETLGIKP